MQVASSSGVAGITEKHRKAFEVFLAALVTARVASEADVQEVADKYREICKHKGEDFDEMMHESALWMKQCVPGGNKKWSLDMSSFNKKGFDLFFHHAPKEIKNILKAGGQPLLNIFSHSLAKDAHASLKTINLHDYEKLIKEKVSEEEIVNVYMEKGHSKLPGEENSDYIERCIMLDFRNAHDDSSLEFSVERLVEAKLVTSAFDRGFDLIVFYEDENIGSLEAQESALNPEELKKMIKAIFADNEIFTEIEFTASQSKIDEKTFDLEFRLLSPPEGKVNFGLASVELTKPDMYKEIVLVNEEPAMAAKNNSQKPISYFLTATKEEIEAEMDRLHKQAHRIANTAAPGGLAKLGYIDDRLEALDKIALDRKMTLSSTTASKKRTYHDDMYDMLENWNEGKIIAIKNKILAPNSGQKHYTKLISDTEKYIEGMGELSNSIAECAELNREDKIVAADKLQQKNDSKLDMLKSNYINKIEPFVMKYVHASVDVEAATPKLFYIGRRDNPQFDKPYYVKYGPLTKTEVKRKENSNYGSMKLTGYDTEEEMNAAMEELISKGFKFR